MTSRQGLPVSLSNKVTQFLRPYLLSFQLLACLLPLSLSQAEPEALAVLQDNCFRCHGDGDEQGGVSFSSYPDQAALMADKSLWLRALKNVRAGLMPPPERKSQPSEAERATLITWIKKEVLQLDPNKPDPGRPVLRRLNRTEYRNTIRDLVGVDFRVDEEFPADDAGHGFDNVGEVLSVSPMLLEKYLVAAKTIVSQAIPANKKVKPFFKVEDDQFHEQQAPSPHRASLRYATPMTIVAPCEIPHDGRYEITYHTDGEETYVEGMVDLTKARLHLKLDGQELGSAEYEHAGNRDFKHIYNLDLKAGRHEISVTLEPLNPGQPSPRNLGVFLDRVEFRGPEDQQFWEDSPEHKRWFPEAIPASQADREAYAGNFLRKFANKAFRRNVDDLTVQRLVALASRVWNEDGGNVENGLRRALEACLSSPRFLFREEFTQPSESGSFPLVDEFSLATRLSYFFWTTMPDEILLDLAGKNQLRAQLPQQISRMLEDPRSRSLVRNFVGQWLQARDIQSIPIEAQFVLMREQKTDPEAENARKRFLELRKKSSDELSPEERAEMEKMRDIFRKLRARFSKANFSGELRDDMRKETEQYFSHVLLQNKPLTELLDSDYAFLNERLAKHYGIPDVNGNEIRQVTLPPESPRGGMLTQGTILAVTSNPTRTSPVKRGLFILENILGTPPPPPPPNIPPLEDFSSGKGMEGTLRQNLARHRADAKCAGCHNRMDPLGLAFENFNAMGSWREQERGQPIDSAGVLVSGDKFQGVRELKTLLSHKYRADFYRCLAEKLLIYSLGRSLTWGDEATLDQFVERMEATGGKARDFVTQLVLSDAFQRRHAATTP